MVGLVLSLDSYGDRQLPISNAPHILFCLPSGPKRILELNCQEPIEFTTESVMATGIFKLRTKGWSAVIILAWRRFVRSRNDYLGDAVAWPLLIA